MDTFSKRFSLEGKVALVTGAAYGIGFQKPSHKQELRSHLTAVVKNTWIRL